jgi:protein TonB
LKAGGKVAKIVDTKNTLISLLGCWLSLVVAPAFAQEVETAIAGQPEFVDVVPGTPPAPVATAATSESKAADERLVSLGRTPAQVAQDISPAAAVSGEIVPFALVRTKTRAPKYPRRAVEMALEGWVDLMVTVSSNGRVENVHVLAAEPRRLFERAAIRAARGWEFEPPIDSGLSDSQQGKYRVNFTLL